MKSLWSHLLVAFFAAFFTFVLFRFSYPPIQAETYSTDSAEEIRQLMENQPSLLTKSPTNSFEQQDFSLIVNRSMPAIVHIKGVSATNYTIGSGSGVLVSSDGFIVTNHHVIEDATTLKITLHNKRMFDAEVIGLDPQTDLALIKINAQNLLALPLGNSDLLDVGEWVLAIGHPFNMNSTVTAGIVSAKARAIDILGDEYSIESFIQTDAVVNPGNSGGPLISASGELVGINTAILTESGVSEGYSFAIPSNLVRKIITDLRAFGKVKRAILGVDILDVTDEMAYDLGLSQVEGVYIQKLITGGTADRAGIKSGDVILKINDVSTATVPALQEQIALYRPGDHVSVEFIRDGKKYRQEKVLLQSLPTNKENRKK